LNTNIYKISEIGSLKNGLNFNRNAFGEGVEIVNVKQLYYGRYVNLNNLETIKQETIPNLEPYLIKEGDILFARSSVMRSGSGKSALVPSIDKNISFSGFVIRFRINDKKKFDPLYVIYLLSSFKYRKIFTQISTGTSISNVSQDTINSIELEIPSIEIQKKLSQIIGSYDDKIEINEKKIIKLNEITKKLYKSFFRDFDLIKSKKKKLNKFTNEFSNLFPDTLEDVNSNLVPKDWKMIDFGEVVQPQRGKVISEATKKDGTIPVIGGGLKVSYYHNEANVIGPSITISASGANAGYVNLHFDDIWASDCSYISKKETKFIFSFYLFLLSEQKKIFKSQTGAAQPHINPKDLMRLKIPSIPENLLFKFEDLIEPIFKKIFLINKENKILEKIRDLLMKKIIKKELII
jgi:type I restriction enzyme, S subunit